MPRRRLCQLEQLEAMLAQRFRGPVAAQIERAPVARGQSPSREPGGKRCAKVGTKLRYARDERWNGVVAQAGQICDVDARSIEIRSRDQRVRIDGVGRHDRRKAGNECTDRKPAPPVAQNRCRQPREDDPKPQHEARHVDAQLRQTKFALIQPHALQRRSHHHEEQHDEHECERAAQALTSAPPHRPVGEQQDGQRERRDGDQLEEAMARVFRIRETGLRLDMRAAPEQVAELDGDEREEEQVESTEDDTDLDRTERELPRLFEPLGKRRWLLLRCEQTTQETGARPAEEKDRCEVDEQWGQIRHRRFEERPEDGVRGDEEPTEENEQRKRETDSSPDGRELARAAPRGHLPPTHVLDHQQQHAHSRGDIGAGRRARVVREVRRVNAQRRLAQSAKADEDGDREQVEGMEPRRRPPDEERGEDKQRAEHPAPAMVERCTNEPDQRRQRDDERDRPERDVETERRRPQQEIAEDAEAGGRGEESEPATRLHAHLPTANQQPLRKPLAGGDRLGVLLDPRRLDVPCLDRDCERLARDPVLVG
jgi:hypothetical protein